MDLTIMTSKERGVILKELREEHPEGTVIELVKMNEPLRTMTPGLKGVVQFVDDAGTIQPIWENGSTLGVVYGEDVVKKVSNN